MGNPIKVTGSARGMNDAVATLHEMGDGLPERIADEAADLIADAVDEQYALGVDPYGEPWAPLAQATLDKGREEPPLTDTHEMRDHTTVTAHGNEIVMRVPDPGGFHQTGTKHMPAREVLPTDAKGMPPAYELALIQAATSAAGSEPEGA